ncbi:uncharacterized protein VTP21DRAFT_4830 [Calcarisporiella thermophila]|uniref:uncharacterized protein n=1 Tax=Calcarisporiella thermophila TaxID=911321 RepID=UPI0037437F0A
MFERLRPFARTRRRLCARFVYLFVIGLLIVKFTLHRFSSTVSKKDEEEWYEKVLEPFKGQRLQKVLRTKTWDDMDVDRIKAEPKLYFPPFCDRSNCSKPLPSFLIAGTQHSGASRLFAFLSQHPSIFAIPRGNIHTARLINKGLEGYLESLEELLSIKNSTAIKGESGVTGMNADLCLYGGSCIQKIIETFPDVKLILILRDPIDRAFAHYKNMRSNNIPFETLVEEELDILRRCSHRSAHGGWTSFLNCHKASQVQTSWRLHIPLDNSPDALETPGLMDMLSRGMYANQFSSFLDQFTSAQLLVLRYEDFSEDTRLQFRRIGNFLGIDPTWFYSRISQPMFDEVEVETENSGSKAVSDKTVKHPIFERHQSLDLGIRYRLQHVFQELNRQMVEAFKEGKQDFAGWDYDIDRG